VKERIYAFTWRWKSTDGVDSRKSRLASNEVLSVTGEEPYQSENSCRCLYLSDNGVVELFAYPAEF